MKYRKKPVEIEAIQLLDTPQSILEVNQFIEGTKDIGQNSSFMAMQKFEEYCDNISNAGGILIKTLESKGDGHFASFGDFVIKGVKGEFYACKPDIFELTYEKVE
jgi:hypothetical protein